MEDKTKAMKDSIVLLEMQCDLYDSFLEKVFDDVDLEYLLIQVISVIIRKMFHETDFSIPICDSKDKHIFCTSGELAKLIRKGMNNGYGGFAKYLAMCKHEIYSNVSVGYNLKKVSDWWKEEVFEGFTRKSLILEIANKDGGAHYDFKKPLSDEFYNIKTKRPYAISGLHSNVHRYAENSIISPIIRQIAEEILKSKNHLLD